MLTCPSCGEENPEKFRLCGYCGAPQHEQSKPAPVEERKVVTMLLCDLVGFTASSDRADPEDVRARIRPSHQQAVGERYVLELLEESRRGMEENTRQGFNTGGRGTLRLSKGIPACSEQDHGRARGREGPFGSRSGASSHRPALAVQTAASHAG